MKKTLLRIDVLFLLTGLILLFFCFLFSVRNATIDVTMHDTYLVIDPVTVGIFLFVLHVFYSLVYFLIRKRQKYALGIIHLILSLLMYGVICKALASSVVIGGVPRRYYTNSDLELFEQDLLLKYLTFIAILFGLSFLVFSLNVVMAIIKRVKP